MTKLTAALCLLAASAALSAAAPAQAAKGDKEVGVGGAIIVSHIKNGGGTLIFGNVTGTLGYYYTPQIKFNVGTSLNISKFTGSGTTVQGQLLYGGQYNFVTQGQKTFPYVGLGLSTSISNAEGASSTTTIDPFGGFQHFLSRTASIFAELHVAPSSDVITIVNTFGFRVVF